MDPYPNWIRIQQLCRSRSVLRIKNKLFKDLLSRETSRNFYMKGWRLHDQCQKMLRWSIKALNCQSFIISRENSAECPTNFRFIWSERKNKTPKRKQLFSPKCENMHNEAKQVYKAKIVGIENMKFCVETKCRFQFSFKKKIVDSKRKMCLVLLDFWVFWTIFALFHFVLLTTSNWKCIFIAILPIGFKRNLLGHSICDLQWLLLAELSKNSSHSIAWTVTRWPTLSVAGPELLTGYAVSSVMSKGLVSWEKNMKFNLFVYIKFDFYIMVKILFEW